ncbi:MAG: Nif3-like dinuclear metal center hexameric protein [Clostridia bacterium]|nr:Nif3-like dinuclear metal center hexameric protein [Clostridia bacterium]
MKAIELMTELIGKENLEKGQTVDTCKWGDPEREIRKVATCLTATPDVLRACEAWGTDLLITHEPCVYDHYDRPRNDKITEKKLELLRKTDFVIWRFHDHIHSRELPDGIHTGFISKLGLKGTYDGRRFFFPDEPISAREIALRAEKACLTKHARIAGDPDAKTNKIALYLGAVGDLADPFASDDTGVAVLGEICEWRNVEQIRDAAQMGIEKAFVVLGHCASEWPGMELLAKEIKEQHAELDVRFIPCGDIYTFTDSEN